MEIRNDKDSENLEVSSVRISERSEAALKVYDDDGTLWVVSYPLLFATLPAGGDIGRLTFFNHSIEVRGAGLPNVLSKAGSAMLAAIAPLPRGAESSTPWLTNVRVVPVTERAKFEAAASKALGVPANAVSLDK